MLGIHMRSFITAVFLVSLLSSVVHANTAEHDQPIVQNIQHDSGMLRYHTGDTQVTVQAINQYSFVVTYAPDGMRQLPSFALADPSRAVSTSLEQASASSGAHTEMVLSTQHSYALINLTTGKLGFGLGSSMTSTTPLIVEEEVGLFATQTLRGFRFVLDDDEQLLGGGQRVLGMDRRGHRMPLYNRAHYGYTTESNQMYYSLPAVISDQHYAILFDNSASGYLDIGHTEPDVLQFEAVAGRTSYIVVLGNNQIDVATNIADVTGKQPLPPRWALGNFASRFGYKSQAETQATVQAFIDQDIPLDAVVLDLFWFGPDIKGHMGNLTWDRNTFPEPEQMIAGFTDQGVNTIVITEPFILSSSKQWDSAVQAGALANNLAGEPRRFDFYFGNTGLVDVFDTDAQRWFNQFYSQLYAQGVTGWWGDLGEPEVHPSDSIHNLDGLLVTAEEIHNVYGHQWAQMVYEHQQTLSPDMRPFVMMRAGFLGSQRYGLIPWTGDVAREWGGLVPQVELALQMSLMGLGYIHSDVGGFAGGETFDPELYIRWTQFGAFSPVFRPHAQGHIAPEPVFHSADVKDIARQYIKLRYALTPYNYTLAMEHSLTGMPLMRPVSFLDPDQFTQANAYLWGESFLVHPVTAPNVDKVSIDLPDGVWFDYATDTRFVGGRTVEVDAPLERLPLLVKAGAFIPMVSPTQHLKAYSSARLNMHYYYDASVKNAHYRLLEDDGVAPNSLQDNAYQRIHFSAVATASILAIDAQVEGSYVSAPSQREVNYIIHNIPKALTALSVNGNPLSTQEVAEAWDPSTGNVSVTITLDKGASVVLSF